MVLNAAIEGQGRVCVENRPWAMSEEKDKSSLEIWATAQIVFHHFSQLLLIGQLQESQVQNPRAVLMRAVVGVMPSESNASLMVRHQVSAGCI